MPKHGNKKERVYTEPFTQIKRWEYQCPAFRKLSGDEFLIYWEMRCRYNGRNNGQIVYSSRQAGDRIGKSHVTGSRALKKLEFFGFIKIHKNYGYNQKRLAREYEITAISMKPAKHGDRLPIGTKDFLWWTEAKIAKLNKGKLTKQNSKNREVNRKKKPKHSFIGENHSSTHENTSANIVN